MTKYFTLLLFALVSFFHSHSQSITVTSPNGGETLYVGKTHTVRWTSSDITANFVKLEYSIDNGASWSLIKDVNDSGTYTWIVPSAVGETALLRISEFGNPTVYDVSDANFSIKEPYISLVTPVGGEIIDGCSTHTVEWTYGGVSSYANLYYSIDEGANWIYITNIYTTGSSKTYNWSVPSLGSSKMRFKIADNSDASIYGTSTSNFSVTQGTNYLTLTSPNGGETFSPSSNKTITWNTTGTVGNVSIRYSKDGGVNWDWVRGNNNSAASNIANSGSFEWLIPSTTPSSNWLIQIYENSKSCTIDYSDNFFSIDNNPSITVTYPNGGETFYVDKSYSISWSASNLPSQYVALDYSINNGQSWIEINSSLYNNGSFYWKIPNTVSTQCLIRVRARDNSAISAVSKASFTIAPPFITLTSPSGGEIIQSCTTHRITWDKEGVSTYVKLFYSIDEGQNWIYIASPYTGTNNYYDWSVPSIATDKFKLKIEDNENSSVQDISANFTVSQGDNYLTLTAPNGGENWAASSVQTITWTSTGTVGNVDIRYSTDGGENWSWVRDVNNSTASNIANTGSFDWLVPSTALSATSMIQIQQRSGTCVVDYNDSFFTIDNSPTITVTSPKGGETFYVDRNYSVTWSASNLPTNYVSIDYSVDNGQNWTEISNSTYYTSSFYWKIPNTLSTECLVRVRSKEDSSISAVSPANFTIVQPFINITSPTEGEVLSSCSTHRITWDKEGVSTYVKLYYSIDEGQNWIHIGTPYIGSNSYYDWSVPSIATDKFKLKIEDNENSSVQDISANFTVSQGDNYLTLTAPNGGENWAASSVQTITWTTTGTVGNVDIRYSTDGGANWSWVRDINNSTASNITNTGSFDWLLPSVALSATSLIQIQQRSGTCVVDYNDSFFTIDNSPTITVTSPKGGEVFYVDRSYSVTWSASNLPTNYVSIDYSVDNGQSWTEISNSTNSNSSFYWKIPNTLSTECLVRVRARDDSSIFAVSPANFTIVKPTIDITSIVGGETIPGCTTYKIVWNKEGVSTYAKIFYSVDGGQNWIYVATPYVGSSAVAEYNWTVPSMASSQFKIRVEDNDNSSVKGISENFSVSVGSNLLTLISPNGGEEWSSSSVKSITWNSTENVGNVSIRYSTNGGTSWTYARDVNNSSANNISNTGSFDWLLPSNTTSSDVLVQVYEYSNDCIIDISDNVFTINTNPVVSLTYPKSSEVFYFGETKRITWQASNLPTNYVKIDYSIDNGGAWSEVIASRVASYGYYDWLVPNMASESVLIRVSAVADPLINDISNTLSIARPIITVLTPNSGNENWLVGENKTITWSTKGLANSAKLKIDYSADNGSTWIPIEEEILNSKSYIWTIPNLSTSSQSFIKITSLDYEASFDTNDNAFTITKPIVGVTVPNDGQTWYVGESKSIQWSGLTGSSNVKIEFSSDGGATYSNIVASTSNTGFYYWNIPYNTTPSTNCFIAVTAVGDPSITDTTDVAFTIAKPVINLTSPNGNENWYLGQTKEIAWTNSGMSDSKVRIEYSSDNAETWSLIDLVNNTGSYNWIIPSSTTPSELAYIRLSNEHDASIKDSSALAFKIIKPSVRITSPNGGETIYKGQPNLIKWVKDGSFSPNVKIEYSANNGVDWTVIVASIANSETYTWNIAEEVIPGDEYQLRISDVLDPTISDVSDTTFTISNPTIKVIYPNGGEVFYPDEAKNIRWQSVALSASKQVQIDYSSDNGATWNAVAITGNSGIYSWTPTNVPATSTYLIRVSDLLDPTIFDVSDEAFYLSKPILKVITPNGGEVWNHHQVKAIKWSSVALAPSTSVKIDYTTDGGGSWNAIVASTLNSGSYNWTIPSSLTSEQVSIRLTSLHDTSVSDESDGNFRVRTPRDGDKFETSIPVTSFPFTIKDTTSLYSDQYTGVGNQPSPDVFYSFVVPDVSDSLSLSINANFQAIIHVLSDQNSVVTSSNSGYNYTIQAKGLIPGNTYYLVVEGNNQGEGRFTLKGTNNIPASDLTVENIAASKTEIAPKDSVAVSWEVKNIGVGKSASDWKERIYMQSSAGDNKTLLKEVVYANSNELLSNQSVSRSTEIVIPSQLNIGDEGVFVVELLPGGSVVEVPGGASNNEAIQQTSWTVQKRLLLELLTTEITEGVSQPLSAKISRSGSFAAPLTVNLDANGTDRLSFPATVTIPAGQASVKFSIAAPNNRRIEGTILETLHFSATGFQSKEIVITVLDNDKATITITDLQPVAEEGETVTFKLNTNLIPSEPLEVFLTSSSQKRFPLPAKVTIPAGALFTEVTVELKQNDIPEIDVEVEILAGAANHNSGSASILVLDDDVPSLELVIHTHTISEGAGIYATQATLRRTSSSSAIAFRANLSADLPNTLIFPSTISLAKGENEKTFNIGAIDNGLVDGDREVELTASVFVNSCGCNAPSTSSGSVSATLTVTDNDGPTLTLTASELTLPEGYSPAGQLRIRRNTPTNEELTVSLTSSDENEATVPSSVVIPIGQSTIDVPITTIDDGVTDGNKEVYFHATSTGFSQGSVWVIVTDQNLPDLQIPAASVEKSSVEVKNSFSYQLSVKNSGFATAPNGVLVRGYLSKDNIVDESDILVSEDIVNQAIPAGGTVQIQNVVQAPNLPGDYKLIFWVNPKMTMTELLNTNNTSDPFNFNVKPDFEATASVSAEYFLRNTPVTITGKALKSNGAPATNRDLEVYIITKGFRRTVQTKTDEQGNYSVDFVPLAKEAGYYTVGASFPGMGLTVEQDNFNILGVNVNSGRVPQFRVELNETSTGSLSVENLSNKSLTNFTLAPVDLPNGAQIQFETVASFAGNASINIDYQVVGTKLSPGVNFEVTKLKAIAQEGTIQTTDVFYFCQAPDAHLVADAKRLDVSASSSKGERLVELIVTNNGNGVTGDISVNLPQLNWLKSVTPTTLPSMGSGDSATVILKFLSLEEVPFDYPIKGNMTISSNNSNTLNIPFTFQKMAESDGALKVEVTNQFTYYSEGEPMVQNAYVKVSNYFSGALYASGYTDANGVFSASNIPEGRHRISVEKEKHLNYSGTVTINPGAETVASVFMNYQAITFDWTVVPTAIEDEYEITLTADFETHIPIPVVTIDMPKVMPQLSGSEVYAFNVVLTNHGLISAHDVELKLPQSDGEYEFVTNYTPADLLAQQSIQVPVVMRRRSGAQGAPAQSTSGASMESVSKFLGMKSSHYPAGGGGSLACQDFAGVAYWYKCNISTGLWQQGGTLFKYSGRTCPSSSTPSSPIFGGGGGGGGGGTVPTCALCPPSGVGTGGSTPVFTTEKASCVECINSIIGGVAGCVGLNAVAVPSCIAGNAYAKKGAKDYILCIPIPGPVGCAIGAAGAIMTCANTGMMPPASGVSPLKSSSNALLDEIGENLLVVIEDNELKEAWAIEYFGDMYLSDAWSDLLPEIETYVSHIDSISPAVEASILAKMAGYEIPQATIEEFILRWNTSIAALVEGVHSPNATYPNIIDWDLVETYSDGLVATQAAAVAKGYTSVDHMHVASLDALDVIIEGQSNAVCVTVKVQFSQQLTMTREAFEGTLDIFNGHPSEAMDSLSVNILITDENGVPSNGVFEIQTKSLTNLSDVTGTGSIISQGNGTVKFLFIPELGAAPHAPKDYNFGGSIRYWDPYASAMVTLPLANVRLTVNPSPNLMLHYFLQRNILGDDPFTKDIIEPSVPAELAVMVENQGYGPAVNMVISSAQPKIIENEKGLAINFQLIGSNFQGQPRNLGVTNINFGTIPPLETRIGQWYLTSSLLGKFVSYEAEVVHSNSFGNPDLSLVKGVELHELTKSIKAYGSGEDNINDFLVNDIFDIDDTPDIIYFSQGNRTAEVFPAESGSFSKSVSGPTYANTLTVTASEEGWNFIKVNDPGNNRYNIVSVTREDGQVIPLDNAWLTFVTLPNSRKPIYENKFHFVDKFSSTAPVTYTVVWAPKDTNVPKVVSIDGADDTVTSVQVEELVVKFSKPIDVSTFTEDDLNLTFQGGANIIDNTVVITPIDSVTFNVDISMLTTGNGFYNFTVQAAEIKDIYGISGTSGKNVTWSQFLTVPTVQAYYGIPEGNLAVAFDAIDVLFNLPIDPLTATADKFTIWKDEVELGALIIDSIRADNKMFYLSGLADLLTADGVYELVVDLPTISSDLGELGVSKKTIVLTLDNVGPALLNMDKHYSGGLDPQHVTSVSIEFDEEVRGFNTASVLLTRNGEAEYLNIAQLFNSDLRNWVVGNLGMLTYPEGEYTLTINLAGFTDRLGNAGVGSEEISWTVDRSALDVISNLTINPDLGYSDSDGITSGDSINVEFDLSAKVAQLTISQIDLSGESLLATATNVEAGSISIPVTLLTGGNTGLKVYVVGENGGVGEAEIHFFVDQKPLFAEWQMSIGQVFEEQIDAIDIHVSDKLLDATKILDAIQLSRNGVAATNIGLSVDVVNDTEISIGGIRAVNSLEGNYKLTIALDLLQKHTSGLKGKGTASVSWSVLSTNNAPVADAGSGFSITAFGTYSLDGTASFDPDSDPITYEWVAPDGIELIDETSATPSIVVSDQTSCGTHSIMLIVRDGSLFSNDFVEVTVDLPTTTYYRDADGDGFGDNNETIQSCVSVPGYVTIGGDCDDSNAAIHPNAIEVEDGVDNNCDGIIDNVQTSIGSEVETNLFTVQVYPIPFEELLYIYIESSDKTKKISLRIYNSIGLLMDVKENVDTKETHIFGEQYAEGLYLIEVVQGENRRIIKATKKK